VPAPVTQTDIVNAAAALLGASERISDIDGAGNLASHARAIWDLTVRPLLADHPWNFAIERKPLNASPAPEFGYERAFELPPGCLRLLPNRGDDDLDDRWEGEVEGNYIISDDEAPLHVRFVSDRYISDCSKWSPHFVEAVMLSLAAALAKPLSASHARAEKLADQAAYALARAKRVDGMQSPRGRSAGITRRSNWLQSQRQPYNRYWR
jgi:hypothetical protein